MNEQEVTEVALFNAHQNQLKTGQNNDAHTKELINVLGGIDQILTKILELNIAGNKTFELSSLQLKNINDIITDSNSKSRTQMNKIQQIATNVEDHDTFYYELDSNDTLLHSIMEERNAQAIIDIMHHRIIYLIIILSAIIWSVLATPFFTQLKYPFYIITMSLFLWIPYSVVMLCMMNRKAAKMVTTNFEFWLKAVYGFVYFFATFVDLYGLHFDQLKEHNGSLMDFVRGTERDIKFMMTADILFLAIVIPLLIIVVSFWDAFYGIRYWKIGLAAFLALQFTLFSIWLQFMSYRRDDIYQITINGLGYPMLSLRITSLKILAIFLWKHAFLAWFRKEKAISIKINPCLVWKAGHIYHNEDVSDDADIDKTNLYEQPSFDSEFRIPAINPSSSKKKPAGLNSVSFIDDNKPEYDHQKNEHMEESIKLLME